ncbi:MAG TPA: ATP-binding cassette domain-containing protein [Sporichthyaceae bacterium]|nr:ATP-binding cassette domain-containing protein [Sporichthyaceae bacterium]
MIEVQNLSKRYGDKAAVAGLSFTVPPGIVTGFLGPNGAGKSTTMRMIAGLDRPTSGWVRVNGNQYRRAAAPMTEMGVLLEANAVHPARSAVDHLRALAQTNGIGRARVDEVLELVGLTQVAHMAAGALSLGTVQRLGIAAALLGDPATVMLDEPGNGLDPEGIRWIRNLLRKLAAAGRAVFVSSHLLSEMALTADRLIVIGGGRLIADTTVEEFVARAAPEHVLVRTPDGPRLAALLAGAAVSVTPTAPGVLAVRGRSPEQIGDLAWQHGLRVHELRVAQVSLEEAFLELTSHSVEFRSAAQSAAPGLVGSATR